jgi:hypothetical protein
MSWREWVRLQGPLWSLALLALVLGLTPARCRAQEPRMQESSSIAPARVLDAPSVSFTGRGWARDSAEAPNRLPAEEAERYPAPFARREPPTIDTRFVLLHVGMFAAAAVDAHSTLRCFEINPSCREANPLFGRRPSATRVWAQSMATKGAVTALDYWLRKRGYKRLWMVAPIAGMALHGIAAHHNYEAPDRRLRSVRSVQ